MPETDYRAPHACLTAVGPPALPLTERFAAIWLLRKFAASKWLLWQHTTQACGTDDMGISQVCTCLCDMRQPSLCAVVSTAQLPDTLMHLKVLPDRTFYVLCRAARY